MQLNPRRILFAAHHCLFDTTSGAAITMRTMLRKLYSRGWAVKVIGAMLSDAEAGIKLPVSNRLISDSSDRIIRINDDGVEHFIIATRSYARSLMTCSEEVYFHSAYEAFWNRILQIF